MLIWWKFSKWFKIEIWNFFVIFNEKNFTIFYRNRNFLIYYFSPLILSPQKNSYLTHFIIVFLVNPLSFSSYIFQPYVIRKVVFIHKKTFHVWKFSKFSHNKKLSPSLMTPIMMMNLQWRVMSWALRRFHSTMPFFKLFSSFLRSFASWWWFMMRKISKMKNYLKNYEKMRSIWAMERARWVNGLIL